MQIAQFFFLHFLEDINSKTTIENTNKLQQDIYPSSKIHSKDVRVVSSSKLICHLRLITTVAKAAVQQIAKIRKLSYCVYCEYFCQ